jgi:hypothetical protein
MPPRAAPSTGQHRGRDRCCPCRCPTSGPDALGGQIVQAAGAALASPESSPEQERGSAAGEQGVRFAGAYALVRHLLYVFYTFSEVGYVWSHFMPLNFAVAVAALIAQLVRIQREEWLLVRDPEYRVYQLRTRWRLLPFVY